jgi:hypothetical protein
MGRGFEAAARGAGGHHAARENQKRFRLASDRAMKYD